MAHLQTQKESLPHIQEMIRIAQRIAEAAQQYEDEFNSCNSINRHREFLRGNINQLSKLKNQYL